MEVDRRQFLHPFKADRPPPDTESKIYPAFIISQRWNNTYVAVEFTAGTHTATSPEGPTAPVAKLVPAQAFHMITPITLFYPVLAKWTWHRVLADPMEREIIDFISSSPVASPTAASILGQKGLPITLRMSPS